MSYCSFLAVPYLAVPLFQHVQAIEVLLVAAGI